MKNILLLTFFISITNYSFTQNETNRGYKVHIGDPIPEMKMKMRNGEIWTNKNFENKVIVVQFTGSGVVSVEEKCQNLKKKFGKDLKMMILY